MSNSILENAISKSIADYMIKTTCTQDVCTCTFSFNELAKLFNQKVKFIKEHEKEINSILELEHESVLEYDTYDNSYEITVYPSKMVSNASIYNECMKLDNEWFNYFHGYFFEGWDEEHDLIADFIEEALNNYIPDVFDDIHENRDVDSMMFVATFCTKLYKLMNIAENITK